MRFCGWKRHAQTLKRSLRFTGDDSPENALAVLDPLEHAAEKLAFLPERGRLVPELKQLDVHAYREITVRPWRIIYRFDADRVYVLGVLDGRRDLGSLLLERLIR